MNHLNTDTISRKFILKRIDDEKMYQFLPVLQMINNEPFVTIDLILALDVSSF